MASTIGNSQSAKETSPRGSSLVDFLLWALVRGVCGTLRMRCENGERIEALRQAHHGAIVALWHGNILIPTYVLRGRGYRTLVSLSRDGERLSRLMRRFGYRQVRGSTGRGGARAALQVCREIEEGNVLCLTPDGPRGPARKAQPGTVFFAQRTGCPIIPIAASAYPRHLLRSWDRFLIPLPFARAAFVVGDPIFVPPGLDESGQARMAEEVERAIDACLQRADEMVGHANGV